MCVVCDRVYGVSSAQRPISAAVVDRNIICALAEPYVTKALLHKLFGPELAAEAAARYFIEGQGPGGYKFRPEYYSEKVSASTQPHGCRVCCVAVVIEGQGPGGYKFRPEYYSEKVSACTQPHGCRVCCVAVVIEGQGPGGYKFRPEYYSEKVRGCHTRAVAQPRGCCASLELLESNYVSRREVFSGVSVAVSSIRYFAVTHVLCAYILKLICCL
jgi:hypothetical protein